MVDVGSALPASVQTVPLMEQGKGLFDDLPPETLSRVPRRRI